MRRGVRDDFVSPVTGPGVTGDVRTAGRQPALDLGLEQGQDLVLHTGPMSIDAQRRASNAFVTDFAEIPFNATPSNSIRRFGNSDLFVLDDEVKFAPAAADVQAVRVFSSLFGPRNRTHRQFHIHPSYIWNRKRYERAMTEIGAFASTGIPPTTLDAMRSTPGRMKLRPRFTKVFPADRPDATPEVYGR